MNAVQAACVIILSAVAIVLLIICIQSTNCEARPSIKSQLLRTERQPKRQAIQRTPATHNTQTQQQISNYKSTRDLIDIVQQRLRQNAQITRPVVSQVLQPVVVNEFAYLIAQGVDAEQQRQIEQALEYERMVRNDDQVGWYQSQNVHDSGVIRTAQKVVQSAAPEYAAIIPGPNRLKQTVAQVIMSAKCDQSTKDEALRALDDIIQKNQITKFDGLSEIELLNRVVSIITDKPELVDYFVTNLSECVGVCGHGRAMRLVDVIAMAQDTPIVPDALIQKRLREKLQSIYNERSSDADSTKTAFIAELNQMQQQGVIDSKQVSEFSTWADNL